MKICTKFLLRSEADINVSVLYSLELSAVQSGVQQCSVQCTVHREGGTADLVGQEL